MPQTAICEMPLGAPAPDVPVCEVVEHGVEEAGQGGQEGLEGALVSGEGQGDSVKAAAPRRGSKMLPNAPKMH